MEPRLVKIFCEIRCEPNPDLADKVCRAIEKRDRRICQTKLWTFSLIGFISLVGLLPVYRNLSGDLAQSGFFDYFSLVYPSAGSDWPILSYWKELSLSLLESLPTVSIISSLALVFILFLSLKYVVKQITKSDLSLSF